MARPAIARADWPRLLSLVEQALDLHPTEREPWLQQLDLSDELKLALSGLLDERHAIETDDFLGSLPAITPATVAAGRLLPGTLIGPWRLLREIGQGGMSTVWLAERADDQLQRQVALKLPHAGPGQDLLAARLLRERNILAALEHRNIARLYDVGLSEAGTPYLVMEYVAGDSLLAHANRLKLGLPQRLALFQQVLRAVQYAHSKLVLHRDLKPGNILVNDAGDVKLLDFGIARLLDEASDQDSALTQHSGHLLTPDYAAPEQIAGLPLGTSCDVYALGVILFELLSGERPYRLPTGSRLRRAALEEAILHAPPRRPSEAWRAPRDGRAWSSQAGALRRALAGDLDLIVQTALHKDPAARYASAEAFAQDLQRHARREPILARPGSRWYRARQFVARHRLAVSAGSAVVLALALGLGAALWQGRLARLEADKATAIKDFLVGLLRNNDLEQADALARRQQTLQQVLGHSAQALNQGLQDQPEVRSELQGLVGGLLYELEMLAEAIPLQQQRVRELAARAAPLEEQVQALRALADSQQGDLNEVAASLDQALVLCYRAGRSLPATCHAAAVERGRVEFTLDRLDSASQLIEPAATALQTEAPGTPDAAVALRTLGELRDHQGRPQEAEALMQQALSSYERLWGPHSARLALERRLWAHRLGLRQRLAESSQVLAQAWQAMAAATGAESVRAAQYELELGNLLARIGLNPAAGPHLQHASSVLLASTGPDRPRLVFETHKALSEWWLYDGQLQRSGPALALLAQARLQVQPGSDDLRDVDLLQSRFFADTGRFQAARTLLNQRRALYLAQGGPRDARVADLDLRLAKIHIAELQWPAADAALARIESLVDSPTSAVGHTQTLALAGRIALLLARGQYAQAWPLIQARHGAVMRRPRADQYRGTVVEASDQMARALLGLGRAAEARPHFEQALAQWQGGYPYNPALAALRARYADCLLTLKQPGLARQQAELAQAALRAEPSAGPQFRRDLDAVMAQLAKVR